MTENPKQDKIDNLNSLTKWFVGTNGHHTGVVYVLRSYNSDMVNMVYAEFGYIPREVKINDYYGLPLSDKFYFYYWLED